MTDIHAKLLEKYALVAGVLAENRRLLPILEALFKDREELVAALARIESHSPESVDKTVLLLNIDGYRECARQALAASNERLEELLK